MSPPQRLEISTTKRFPTFSRPACIACMNSVNRPCAQSVLSGSALHILRKEVCATHGEIARDVLPPAAGAVADGVRGAGAVGLRRLVVHHDPRQVVFLSPLDRLGHRVRVLPAAAHQREVADAPQGLDAEAERLHVGEVAHVLAAEVARGVHSPLPAADHEACRRGAPVRRRKSRGVRALSEKVK